MYFTFTFSCSVTGFVGNSWLCVYREIVVVLHEKASTKYFPALHNVTQHSTAYVVQYSRHVYLDIYGIQRRVREMCRIRFYTDIRIRSIGLCHTFHTKWETPSGMCTVEWSARCVFQRERKTESVWRESDWAQIREEKERFQRKHNFPLTKWIYIRRGVVYVPIVIGCSFSFSPTVHMKAPIRYFVPRESQTISCFQQIFAFSKTYKENIKISVTTNKHELARSIHWIVLFLFVCSHRTWWMWVKST